MNNRGWMALLALGVLALLALDSFFIVNQKEKAVLKQFSRIDKTDIEPGLYFKWPLVEEVVKVDGRALVYDVRTQSFLTAEKKLLNVDAFVIWRISNVQRYIVSVGGGSSDSQVMERRARELLDPRINEGLRNEFASRTVFQVVAGESDVEKVEGDKAIIRDPTTGETVEVPTDQLDESVLREAKAGKEDGESPAPSVANDQREALMDQVREEVNKSTLEDLGIEVVDIRVKQVDWPDQVRGRVFDRMRAERQRDAAAHRSQGREEAEKIRASADRQRTETLAQAYRKAQSSRGEGDAEAAAIYAKAYNQDKEFFRFYRSLRAYTESFDQPEDVLILEPDSDFFRYLKGANGRP
ncbi:protease modulator HflC [Alcanivorax sp.]|uniref:protease modulator HflC n=1 Tax=Alcanivorax sp. TaxID=1872427 RepID=UPI000C36A047|nr:protease modulator HflC [Alcanivorax sp.]MBQ26313.1 HflC protein [Alcanivorax sp.]|tara:strand:- start:463 stop:1524 length:1062 start_codon:yes stop_codon:yes gene_type:complete